MYFAVNTYVHLVVVWFKITKEMKSVTLMEYLVNKGIELIPKTQLNHLKG